MNSNQHLDDESIRQAYRATALAEPGPALDARILQAAHAALSAPIRKPARWSWLVLPLSAAAVAILVTTLALQWRQAPSMPPLDSIAVTAPTPIIAQHEVAKVEGVAKPARQHAELKIASAKPAPQAERRAIALTATRTNEAALQKRQALQSAAAEPALTPSLEAAPQAPAAVIPLADAAAAETRASTSTAAEPRAFAPHLPTAQRQTLLPDRLAEGASLQSKTASGAETPTQKQIAEIRKLKYEGKLEAAKKALAALRKQFPQYQLPEDLRALIEPAAEEN